MKPILITVLALSLLPLRAASADPGVPTMLGEDDAAIEAVLSNYESALNASDVDAVIRCYSHDGVFMPAAAPTAVGSEQVRASYEHVFGTIRLAIRFSVDELVVDGNLAFARTMSRGTVTVLASGATAPEENRELFVFRKDAGVWRIARYIFNKTS